MRQRSAYALPAAASRRRRRRCLRRCLRRCRRAGTCTRWRLTTSTAPRGRGLHRSKSARPLGRSARTNTCSKRPRTPADASSVSATRICSTMPAAPDNTTQTMYGCAPLTCVPRRRRRRRLRLQLCRCADTCTNCRHTATCVPLLDRGVLRGRNARPLAPTSMYCNRLRIPLDASRGPARVRYTSMQALQGTTIISTSACVSLTRARRILQYPHPHRLRLRLLHLGPPTRWAPEGTAARRHARNKIRTAPA